MATICLHCATLAEPNARIHRRGLLVGRLSPKVDTLVPQSLFWLVPALDFSDILALPFGEIGIGGTVPANMETGLRIQVHMNARSSLT